MLRLKGVKKRVREAGSPEAKPSRGERISRGKRRKVKILGYSHRNSV